MGAEFGPTPHETQPSGQCPLCGRPTLTGHRGKGLGVRRGNGSTGGSENSGIFI